MRNIKCSDCAEYHNEWCEKIIDSPHPDMFRDCQYWHERSDYINRQDAIDEVEKWIETYSHGRGGQRERNLIKHVISGINKLPSAQPLTAYVISDEDGNIKCSNCGSFECWGNYCMNCGADMQNAKQDLVEPMSPEKAVDLLDNLLGTMEDSQGNDYDKALHMGIDAIKKTQWIPCSERLPERQTSVLVTDFDAVEMAYINGDGKWMDYFGDKLKAVTAWRPLPEPYKESEVKE